MIQLTKEKLKADFFSDLPTYPKSIGRWLYNQKEELLLDYATTANETLTFSKIKALESHFTAISKEMLAELMIDVSRIKGILEQMTQSTELRVQLKGQFNKEILKYHWGHIADTDSVSEEYYLRVLDNLKLMYQHISSIGNSTIYGFTLFRLDQDMGDSLDYHIEYFNTLFDELSD